MTPLLVALAAVVGGAPPPLALPGDLVVTEGEARREATGWLTVESPAFRGTLGRGDGRRARLRFRYLGAVSAKRALASGAVREQLGLKLLAQNSCNVLYVMWRLAPGAPSISVQVKRNEGHSRHRECGASGYRTLRPSARGKPPPLAPNTTHELSAHLAGDRLEVRIDGRLVWEGEGLATHTAGLAGTAGVRSDNVRWTGEMEGGRDD